MLHHTVDFRLCRRLRFGFSQPFSPGFGKELIALGLHQTIEIVIHFPFRIPDKFEFFIANGSLRLTAGLMD